MTIEELKNQIFSIPKPKYWRNGQFVFNYIDTIYSIAREIQFKDGIDCFYDDSKIDKFLECAIKRLNNGN